MGLGWRRVVLLCVAAVTAIVVLVPGGGAAQRQIAFNLEVVPGPGEVTYGENIAYRAQISNTSGTTLTHVIFRMRKPFVGSADAPDLEAVFKDSTCPQNGGLGVTVTYSDGTSEWTCDFGNLPAWTDDKAQVTLSVVWQVPPSTQTTDCDPGCLQAPARVTVKEGINDQTNPNDAFEHEPVLATLLAADSDNSQNSTSAGGYEVQACTDTSGPGSLRTKQKLDAVGNKVSTMVCINEIPESDTYLGLATTILEGVLHPFNPGHSYLETSDVCIAELGANCGSFGQYTPQVFAADHPITLVFRVPDDALKKGDTITNVWHNYDPLTNPDPLPLCTATAPVPLNGCLDGEPTLSKGKVKVWTIIVKSRTNGWHTW